MVCSRRRIEDQERFGKVQSEGLAGAYCGNWWLAECPAGLAEHRLPRGLNVGDVDLKFSGEGWNMIRELPF